MPTAPSGPPASLLQRLWSRYAQLVRYLFVGGFNTAFGYSCFAVLNFVLADRVPYAYMVANIGSNIVAITVAFLLYKWFVFRTKGNYLREYLRTYVVYGSSALLGLALLPVLVAVVGMYIKNERIVPYVAQAIVIPLVVIISFVGHKRFSFRA